MYSASCKPRHDRGSGCTESIPYAHPHEYTHTQPRMRPGSLLPIRPSDGVTIADSISRSGPQISRLCWDCACFPPPCHPHSSQARSRIACYIMVNLLTAPPSSLKPRWSDCLLLPAALHAKCLDRSVCLTTSGVIFVARPKHSGQEMYDTKGRETNDHTFGHESPQRPPSKLPSFQAVVYVPCQARQAQSPIPPYLEYRTRASASASTPAWRSP